MSRSNFSSLRTIATSTYILGQSAPCDQTAKARVVELLVKIAEASFDVPQTLAIGQLSEGHAKKLIETGEVANPAIALMARHATIELVLGQKVHQLREDIAIVEHEPAPAVYSGWELAQKYAGVQIEDNRCHA